jgi:hypothetical protein
VRQVMQALYLPVICLRSVCFLVSEDLKIG